jgi:hypothetical protein|tara:strand:+ start:2414 stop:2995 length:582 start_codon:yes stop_codon:yes gene_type:complete
VTALKRITAEKRLFILPLVVGLALNAALFALAVYPLTVRVANAKLLAAAAVESLEDAEQAQAEALAILESKSRADADLRTFYEEVLPLGLPSARRITYAQLAAMAEGANLRHDRRSSVAEQDRGSRLARLRTTMVLAGEYADVREFIYQLETADAFVVIEGVSLVQPDEEATSLVLTLEVSTYFWSDQSDADA